MIPSPPPDFNLASYLLDQRIQDQQGENVAIISDQGQWTYQYIYEESNRFARLLQSQDVRPEERILLAVTDSVDFVIAFFGILKVGAVVVMINPDLKADQITEMLMYSRCRGLVLEKGYESSLIQALLLQAKSKSYCHWCIQVKGGESKKSSQVDLTSLTHSPSTHTSMSFEWIDDEEQRRLFSSDALCVETHRDDPAIWLFSGGTTGTPKAIVQPHRSFMHTTECYAKRVLGYRETDRVLSVPKLYFGYATGANLIFPFSVGATSILFSGKPSVDVLVEQIKKHRPTLFINVPTVINRILSYEGLNDSDLASIRITTSAGEALPAPLHEEWAQRFNTPLLDGLGTAEMWHIFITNRVDEFKVGTLGKAVDGFEISLRDVNEQEVPQGEAGVLWVKGGARALGYWRQNDASFKVFRGEWYRSGDLLKQDEEGFYLYCGRQDDMIKVAGKWVSPKEVEDALMRFDLIDECAVIGKPDQQGLLKAYAYYSTYTQEPLSSTQEVMLKDQLLQRLDRYKLPKSITFVKRFKRTHLGKIDRGALKKE